MNNSLTHNTRSGESKPTVDWRIIVRFAIIALLIPLVLFLSAGRVDWWQAWMYTILTIVVSLVSRYMLFLKNPELIAERARFTQSEGIKDWDKRIVVLIAIVGPLAFMITAGLDKRYGWSPEVALPVQLIALVVFLLGYAFSTLALMVNKYFSSVVRIQTERGQTVVMSGPYRFVRHPGYSGGLVAWLVSPILLGALWSFIPVALVIVLYIVRTALEDRTLQNELPGYKEYAGRVRYRLLPGVW
jgi:protein-S-isoprenylcysteine O-methyltransferase Ste14